MSNKKHDDGGEAFPLVSHSGVRYPGMTLLDWFAGRALAEMPADPDTDNLAELAKHAYDQAEAMIAEKRKREGR